MSRWFRFYADAIRNPKVAKLSDSDYRLWTELLAVAAENDGAIPCLDDLKSVLKRRLDHLSRGLDRLIRAGLIDPLGGCYEPHNWNKFQYKSDTSTPRVTLHRAKVVTPPETETETEEEPLAKANGHSPDSDKVFWDSAKAFLPGKNPGALIGKWCRDHGKAETAKAIGAAQIERADDPVGYIEGVLRKSKSATADGWQFAGGPC